MRRLLFILAVTIVSCGTPKQKLNNLTSGADTAIAFSDRIILCGQHSDEFGGTSFKPITILFDNKIIFRDSLNDYWLIGYSSKQYPKSLKCADGNCQLLIEMDERPNQNELARLTVSNNGQLHQDRLPIFNWNPADIDKDGILEVSGILTNGETIANGDSAFYNPTLVYELTDNCLSLDSLATIGKNKKIWGQFYGYQYNDSLLLPFDRREW